MYHNQRYISAVASALFAAVTRLHNIITPILTLQSWQKNDGQTSKSA